MLDLPEKALGLSSAKLLFVAGCCAFFEGLNPIYNYRYVKCASLKDYHLVCVKASYV